MMDARQALKAGIDMSRMVCNSYIEDLTDEDLMKRPHPVCNHINWQLGHLISSDHNMVSGVIPDSMPALPDGFAEKYTKETASSDDASAFCTKAELLAAAEAQLNGALEVLKGLSDEDLDTASPEPINQYAPTTGHVFELLGSHWMMHCGQWVVVRRQMGKAPLF